MRLHAYLEFLMTYGWAILVIVAATFILAYLGVLTPIQFDVDKCKLDGIKCVEPFEDFNTGIVKLAIINELGYPIDQIGSEIKGTRQCEYASLISVYSTLEGGVVYSDGVVLGDRESAVIEFRCNGGLIEEDLKTDIEISYRNVESGITHVTDGVIRVEH